MNVDSGDRASHMPTPTLNLIGTGKLGTVLPRLLADADLVRIQQLYNPNIDSARRAAAFIGSGTPIADIDRLLTADCWLLAVPDGVMVNTVAELANLPLRWQDSIVFHCSGITGSMVLQPLAEQGALIASVHPVHSFADPSHSLNRFAGTYCSLEGQAEAVLALCRWVETIGGQPLIIDSDHKALYHSAMTMASNNLVALLEVSVELLANAGIPRNHAMRVIAPMVRQTADNVFNRGTGAALTGPILRGDAETVDRHVAAIAAATPDLLEIYRALGRITLKIARQQQQHAASAPESGRRSGDHLQQSMNLIAGILDNTDSPDQ